jgi:transposase
MGARPTRFSDPEVRKRFLTAMRAGATYKHACRYARIDFKTWQSWKANAKTANPDPEIVAFLEEVELAQAEGDMVLLANIRQAAQDPKNWTAAAWMLERRHPEEYGRPEARLGVVPTEEPTGATDEAKVDAVTKAMGLDTTNAPTDE